MNLNTSFFLGLVFLVSLTSSSQHLSAQTTKCTFQEWASFKTSKLANEFAVGDVNGDSSVDIVTVGPEFLTISIYFGDGSGEFTEEVSKAEVVGNSCLEIFDIDHDNDLDLIGLSGDFYTVALNDGFGTFETNQSEFLNFTEVLALEDCAIGDLNGDDFIDMVAVGFDFGPLSEWQGILENNFTGGLNPNDEFLNTGVGFVSHVMIGDIDGDLDNDIVNVGDGVAFFFNNGNATFSASDGPSDTADRAELLDADGDSNLDLVLGNFDSANFAIWSNDGLGNYKFAQQFTNPGPPSQFVSGDIDNNGTTDLVIRSSSSDSISLYSNNGKGEFLLHDSIAINDAASVQMFDIDGDDDLDLIVKLTNPDRIAIFSTDCRLLGDVNQDGTVDLLDVAPFVAVLTTFEFQIEADINQDGVVDLLDVQPFVELIGS